MILALQSLPGKGQVHFALPVEAEFMRVRVSVRFQYRIFFGEFAQKRRELCLVVAIFGRDRQRGLRGRLLGQFSKSDGLGFFGPTRIEHGERNGFGGRDFTQPALLDLPELHAVRDRSAAGCLSNWEHRLC